MSGKLNLKQNSQELHKNAKQRNIKVGISKGLANNKISYINCTFKEFADMFKRNSNQLKELLRSMGYNDTTNYNKNDSPWVVDGTFVNTNTSQELQLRKENVVDGIYLLNKELLTLDIDGWRGTREELFDILKDEFGQYNHIIYSSYSDGVNEGSESCRIRVFVQLSRSVRTMKNLDEYSLFAESYIKYMTNKYPNFKKSSDGSDSFIDKSSTKNNQIFLFGSHSKESKVDYYLDVKTDGDLLDFDYLYNAFECNQQEVESRSKLIVEDSKLVAHIAYNDNVATKPEKVLKGYSETKLLKSLDEIKQLLDFIKPDLERDEWRDVIFAVCYETKKHISGYELVYEWCQKDKRIEEWGEEENDREIKSTWDSARTDGNSKTIKYLKKLAEECLKKENKILQYKKSKGYFSILDRSKIKETPKLKCDTEKVDIGLFNDINDKSVAFTDYNVKVVLESYGIDVKFDDMKKEIIFDFSLEPSVMYVGEHSTTDCKLSYICSLLRRNRMSSHNTHEVLQMIQGIARRKMVYPFVDFIKEKPWDGVTRIDNFIDILPINAEGEELRFCKTLIFKWLMSSVALQFNDDLTNLAQSILILHGSQGIGKSTWVESLLPKKLSDYVISIDESTDIFTFDGGRIMGKAYFVEIAEIDRIILSKDESNIKALLGSVKKEGRMPYEKALTTITRKYSLIGTTNCDKLLKDQSGNRRYWIIPLKDQYFKNDIDMQQLYAELYFKYQEHMSLSQDEKADSEYRWWLNDSEIGYLNMLNNLYMEDSTFLESVLRIARPHDPTKEKRNDFKWLNITAILSLIEWNTSNVSTKMKGFYGAELRKNGFKYDKAEKRYCLLFNDKNIINGDNLVSRI